MLVVVVAGLPGAGKSTLASHLCAALGGAALVDKDTLEWPLVNAALKQAGIAPDAHFSELYVNELKALSYETMERVAEQNARAGTTVVLVAPYTAHLQDASWPSRLSQRCAGAAVQVLWVVADPAEVEQRKGSRGEARDLVEAAYPHVAEDVAVKRRQPIVPHKLVDTSRIALSSTAELAGVLAADLLAAVRGSEADASTACDGTATSAASHCPAFSSPLVSLPSSTVAMHVAPPRRLLILRGPMASGKSTCWQRLSGASSDGGSAGGGGASECNGIAWATAGWVFPDHVSLKRAFSHLGSVQRRAQGRHALALLIADLMRPDREDMDMSMERLGTERLDAPYAADVPLPAAPQHAVANAADGGASGGSLRGAVVEECSAAALVPLLRAQLGGREPGDLGWQVIEVRFHASEATCMARNIERCAARGLPPRTAADMADRRRAGGWDETGGGGVDEGGRCSARVVRLDTDDMDRDAIVRCVLDAMNGGVQSEPIP